MIFQFAPFYRPEKVLLKEDSGFTSELSAAHAAKAVAFLRTRPTLMTIDFAITFRIITRVMFLAGFIPAASCLPEINHASKNQKQAKADNHIRDVIA
jgi:hypothetical protein